MTNPDAFQVWHIDSGKRPGGGQIQVGYLLNGLAERGVECTLICPPESPILASGISPQVKVRKLKLKCEWDIFSVLQLRRWIKQEEPDIIHAHDAKSHTVALLARTNQQRLVVHRRVTFPIKRHFLTKWKYGKGVDHFIAVASCVAGKLQENDVPQERITVINSAVDDSSVITGKHEALKLLDELGLNPDMRIIGTVGRLTKEKRHEWLLEVLRPTLAQHSDIRIIIIGAGPEYEKIMQVASGHGIKERVIMTGHREDVWRFYSIFDVFILCSLSEGYPVSLVEAMASGCAVMSTQAGAVEEMIEHDRDGILIARDDGKALRESLERLLTDENRRAELAQAAQDSAREKCGVDSMVESVFQVYKKLLDRPAKSCI